MTDHDTDAVSRITALMATHAYAKASAEERARMIVAIQEAAPRSTDTGAVVERALDAVEALWERDETELGKIVQAVFAALRPGDHLPGGLVCMPEEPSAAMMSALWSMRMSNTKESFTTCYRAMLRAAGDGQ